jgi:general secretion pathway protein K
MISDDPRRGTILVAVLWTVALLSALAMAASTTFRGFGGVIIADRDRIRAEALLTAGLEAAAALIGTLGDTPLQEIDSTIRLSTGSVRMSLSDEGGRIDVGQAPVEVLVGLFRSIGASERQASDVAQQIIEWRNPNNTGRSNDAPEKSAQGADADWPFTDIRQLSLIPGMPPGWVDAIAPLTTVYGSETVNPLTGSAGVIAALPGIDEARLQAFLDMRRIFPADAARLEAILAPAQRYLEVKPQQVISVYLESRLADGFQAAARSIIVVLPDDSQPYRVLAWNPLPSPSGKGF